MKKQWIAMALAMGLGSQFLAAETLQLRLEPDRDYLLANAPGEVTVKIDLLAASSKKRVKRTPLNLAAVIDRSGSMTGAKIEKARQAAIGLVDQLGPGDKFALIAYDTRAELIVPSQEVEDKEALKRQILRLQAGGSTALYAGVKMGAEQLRKQLSSWRINRIMLLSDGLANVGPSSPRELRELGRQLSREGIAVTTIGVGDDYNEDLMSGLAEASDANYYYVKDTEKLPEIFARELGELLTVAARSIRIEIVCPDGVRPLGLIGRPETFQGQRAIVLLSQLSPAQTRSVFLKCRLEGRRPEIARVRVQYADEVNGGQEQSLAGTAVIRFTEDRELAANSQRQEVVAQTELLLTAIAKDQALADADAGRYQAAAQTLARQATLLDAQARNAPDALQSQMREEAANLRARSSQMEQNQYNSGMRKVLQSESWLMRNSK